MVLPGQYLERPALIAVGELTLEGLYHRGRRRPSLLVCPDPGEGAGMAAPAVAELAWACARAGHASLRFEHRGRGASQGAPDPGRALDDALAAHQHLVETARGPVAVAGIGAGWRTALAVARARPGIGPIVLVAPPEVPSIGAPSGGAPPAPSEAASEWAPSTARRGVPVLAILPAAGGPSPDAVAAALGPAARIEVVPGTDPRFLAGLPAIGRLAVEWIELEVR